MTDATLGAVEIQDEVPSTEAVDEKKREVSTIGFPYDDLNAAIGVARAVFEQGGKCGNDQLAGKLQYSGVENGAFRVRVASARIFGLVTVSREGISLAPIGQMIVDPGLEIRGRHDAFQAVPLYKAVYERFKGTVLPPSIGLENVFVELGVSSKQTDRARQVMQRSAEQAGYFGHGRDRLIAPILPGPQQGQKLDLGEPGGGSDNGNGGGNCTHPKILDQALMLGLIEALPPAGSVWDQSDRDQWAVLAKSIFNHVYKQKLLALPDGRPGTEPNPVVEAAV